MKGEELSKEKAKVFSYPKHELIEKHMKDLKLLDRAVLPGMTHPYDSFMTHFMTHFHDSSVYYSR